MCETIKPTKICSKCKVNRLVSDFYKEKNRKDGLQTKCIPCCKLYNSLNKDKISENGKKYWKEKKYKLIAKKREYYENNKDRILIKNRKYYKDNRSNILLQKKQYNMDNKDEISKKSIIRYENNKNIVLERNKMYFRSPHGNAIHKNKSHKRRSIKIKGDVTANQIMLLERDAKICYWCHNPLKNKKVHIDHYVALSKGGEHTLSNLVVSCSKCNQRKSAKDPIKFANSLGRLL